MTSHSTTTTATYVLQKYSRSYPSAKENANGEWQHFTNPIIKLILDIKKSSSTELESVRMRIIWTMSPLDSSSDRNEVAFEDIDLLSFSSISSRNQLQSLPLKAVYRDSIVGIRYLASRDTSNASYRRFQIAFTTPLEASQFIDSISSVCPCKSNAAAGAVQSQFPIPPGHARSNLLSYATHNPVSTPVQTDPFLAPAVSQQMQRSGPSFISSSPSIRTEQLAPLPPPQAIGRTGSVAYPQPNFSVPYWPTTPSKQPEISVSQTSSATIAATPSAVLFSGNSTPHGQLSLPKSTHQPPQTSKLCTADKATQTFDPFMSALREATSLYSLSHESLENLIGDVVREDGFTDLMEQLSTMWKVKGYIQMY
ncbi:hypothetical protein D9758_001874 [Tetrapyrgos nigripes]|uniref:Uncharacterized protein n=1 Tax=Tetrapyrgos nigripes TaxID=182062 RepID=A0A8H5GT98_9AGAR|nr:hypothetical protein D9758_001874 [Tetrapyrgos nigripes]